MSSARDSGFASAKHGLVGRSASMLFRRCYQCPDTVPSCPPCNNGETCSLVPKSCNYCAYAQCVSQATLNPSTGAQSVAGPIAGGVIGGIAAVAIITYLVWRFCIKKRRAEFDPTEWPDSTGSSEKEADADRHRSGRASTHTLGSRASTSNTRASNIIQIAYIPGVTNRSEGTSDLVPPVPPIPAASASRSMPTSPHLDTQDQHFFLPSDLRNSQYTQYTGRDSVVRSSVATDAYIQNAVVNPVPAQTVTRAKATPVSVKIPSRDSPADSPILAPSRGPSHQSSIVGRFAQPKEVIVTRTAARKNNVHELETSEAGSSSASPRLGGLATPRPTASPKFSHQSSTFEEDSGDEDDGPDARPPPVSDHSRRSRALSDIQDSSPVEMEGSAPFGAARQRKTMSVNQMIEDATRRAAQAPRHGGLGNRADGEGQTSPFADSHQVGTP